MNNGAGNHIRFCQRHGNIELTVFTNPIAGIEQVKKIKPNILFLDIEMEDINGRDLARDLPHEVMLIFYNSLCTIRSRWF